MMKHRPHSKEKKTLSMPGLLEVVSEKIHCKNCCKKEHQDGRVTYHHQILGAVLAHPDCRQVIPLCPEPITKQDGATKNDCERNACHRFLTDLKREHPRLNLTICSDALSATAPHINELKTFGYHFIIVVKPEGNRTLYEWVKGITREMKVTVGKNKYIFRYVEATCGLFQKAMEHRKSRRAF